MEAIIRLDKFRSVICRYLLQGFDLEKSREGTFKTVRRVGSKLKNLDILTYRGGWKLRCSQHSDEGRSTRREPASRVVGGLERSREGYLGDCDWYKLNVQNAERVAYGRQMFPSRVVGEGVSLRMS